MTPIRLCLALLLLTVATPAMAQDTPFTGADIEAATFVPGGLPSGRSPLTAKVQMLLDRAGISPGVTDGFKGGMSESAIRAFERQRGLPIDGILDAQVWALLQPYAAEPVTQFYTVTEEDGAGLVASIPVDYAEKAQMEHLGYTSIAERLGERFHMDEKFIGFLNPGVTLAPGATITVMRPAKRPKSKVARIIVDSKAGRVAVYDDADRLVADYPATVGSSATPSPSGNHVVRTVALNPNYTYNPDKNFRQGDNDKVLTIPPGPNGPVGTVWIALSKPTYGIHGTPTPSRLFVNQSYGCVRLTNWDAWELAHMVQASKTTVEFLPEGTSITDVIPPVTAAVPDLTMAGFVPGTAVPRPLPRPIGVALAAAASGVAAAAGPDTSGAVEVTPAGPTGPGSIVLPVPADAPLVVAPADPLAQALSAASGGAAPVEAVVTPTPTPAPVPAPVPARRPTPTPAPIAVPGTSAEVPSAVTITPAAPTSGASPTHGR